MTEGSPELWASSGQLAERTGRAAASHATLNKCDRVPRRPSADQEQSDKILKTATGGGHVTGRGDEPPPPTGDPGLPTEIGIKDDQDFNATGGAYNESHSSRRCGATGTLNATERPCRGDAEHATRRVSKRDKDAAVLDSVS